jgi:hypothetical protein
VKVKSHSKIVDNIRVDYLSKQAFKKETPISYNEFLGCCFFKYKSETPTKFNLPFMPDNIKKEIQI